MILVLLAFLFDTALSITVKQKRHRGKTVNPEYVSVDGYQTSACLVLAPIRIWEVETQLF